MKSDSIKLVYDKSVECKNTEETKAFSKSLIPLFNNNDVIILSGDLGAGKTQFVSGVAQGYEIQEDIISPTFNILLEYDIPVKDGPSKLYHFDLYRLNSANDLEDIGFFDTIESGGISFIEWGEKFIDVMPQNCWHVNIVKKEENIRNVTVERAHNG